MTIDLSEIFNRQPLVLVADDDKDCRELLQAYLEVSGCRVITAPDSPAALACIQRESVDLILLDVKMPGMTGVELCRKLKSDESTCRLPVMIVTAHDTELERLEAIDAGADEFLGKPYNSLILLTRARSLLRLRKLSCDLEKRNAFLRNVLHRYVAEPVAETILSDPERNFRLGGETRLVTVMFADLQGFTQFTESHSAEEVVGLLNRIFPTLSSRIMQRGGTFDKFIGDAVMAFYGAPLSTPDDARQAVESAREMQVCFQALLEEDGMTDCRLTLGIGLHTGEAIVGNIGSEKVMDYTVVGDTVNIAQRLQEEAGPGEVWISERTHIAAGRPHAEDLGDRILFGRSEPVRVFRLI